MFLSPLSTKFSRDSRMPLPGPREPDPCAEFVEADQNYKTPLTGWVASLVGGVVEKVGVAVPAFSLPCFFPLCVLQIGRRARGGVCSISDPAQSHFAGGGILRISGGLWGGTARRRGGGVCG